MSIRTFFKDTIYTKFKDTAFTKWIRAEFPGISEWREIVALSSKITLLIKINSKIHLERAISSIITPVIENRQSRITLVYSDLSMITLLKSLKSKLGSA